MAHTCIKLSHAEVSKLLIILQSGFSYRFFFNLAISKCYIMFFISIVCGFFSEIRKSRLNKIICFKFLDDPYTYRCINIIIIILLCKKQISLYNWSYNYTIHHYLSYIRRRQYKCSNNYFFFTIKHTRHHKLPRNFRKRYFVENFIKK